ncbi:HEAT repeat domain-containing protein [Maioricimonas rarisocia]|nr:HEAT repeat domain-containing protein [Maioricimonas rarisocia]
MIPRFWIACCCLFALADQATAQLSARPEAIRVQFAMYEDPELETPDIQLRLKSDLLPLWREALRRPEADYQRLTASAIAEAAEAGFPDLEPAQDDLEAVLKSEQNHLAARTAAARALIALESRDSAPLLFEVSQSLTTPIRMLVEPALAAWGFEPILPVWRDRVRDPQTSRRELVLALDGLAQAGDAQVLDNMLKIVHAAGRPADIRLAAARAAGAATDKGLEPHAGRLTDHPRATAVHRLCAVALLKRQSTQSAQQQLATLASDDNPAVAEQALGHLFAIDPAQVIPLADQAIQRPDPKVRRRGADAFVAVPDPQRVEPLASLLDDPHPDVRRSVRDDLYRLAGTDDLSDAVRRSARAVLNNDSWRGQEQAAILLGALDEETAATRLLDLLQAERPEVKIAAAWALRKLAIPETAPELFEHVQQQTKARRSGRGTDGLDEQVAHLFEALAILNFAPAEDLLREYVPKKFINGYYSRGAAIWSLGLMYAGRPDEDLVGQFVERMMDMHPTNPDVDIVYEMSATSLGRMNAESRLPEFEQRLGTVSAHDRLAYAIRWSIEQITGEPAPSPGPAIRSRAGWFLEPAAETDPVAE